ncbi:transcription termination factor Rho [Bacillota bacterium HCP3S3_F1_1]|nr:transcription termination factor Rho [Bacillota bacterium]MDD7253089.1 transcription termination factor Rho [Bacillota bacterium]
MYESLQVKDLKEIAASRGLSLPARVKKEDIVGKLLELDRAEDEKVLKEREAARAQREGAGEREHSAPARRGRKPGARKEEGREGRKEKEGPASEKRRAGRPRKKEASAEAAQTESPVQMQTAASGSAASSYQESAQEMAPAQVQETAASMENPNAGQQPAEQQLTGQQPAESAAATAGNPGTVRANANSEAVRSSGNSEAVRANANSEVVRPSGNADAARAAGNPASEQGRPDFSPSQAVAGRYARRGLVRPDQQIVHKNELNRELDSGEMAHGILEVLGDGYGFIRSSNYMPGDNDVYVAPSQIRRFNLKTGDIVEGNIRIRSQNEKFSALLFVKSVNGIDPEESKRRYNFEDMTPIFPDDRIRLEKPGASIAMRVMDLMCPVGKGQRGMIVSPPKAGKTTLMKEVAKSVKANNPDIHLIILLIDERPEEVTDIREALEGPNVEVIYSTFDELPEHHKRVAEMTIERAKRLVESKRDVMILLDSITRLTRAYNLTEPSSGRTLSGGLDPVALHMPKRFFGAARNMREGGSLTILATALIETGSKMDDVVYEEFKGTGNMEMILNRKLSERRIFPAVDLAKSGTRRDDLLLTPDEQECVATIRKAFIGARGEEATDSVLDLFYKTRTNGEFVNMVKKHMWSF